MSTFFIDESKAKGYTLVAAEVDSREIAQVRRNVTSLRMPGQRRVHFVREGDRRRRHILASLQSLGVRARVYHASGLREGEARAACLASAVRDAAAGGVERLVLELDASAERADRRVLARATSSIGATAKLAYGHESPSVEPLLWIPDAIAWSYSRGGEWSERIKGMLVSVEEVGR